MQQEDDGTSNIPPNRLSGGGQHLRRRPAAGGGSIGSWHAPTKHPGLAPCRGNGCASWGISPSGKGAYRHPFRRARVGPLRRGHRRRGGESDVLTNEDKYSLNVKYEIINRDDVVAIFIKWGSYFEPPSDALTAKFVSCEICASELFKEWVWAQPEAHEDDEFILPLKEAEQDMQAIERAVAGPHENRPGKTK